MPCIGVLPLDVAEGTLYRLCFRFRSRVGSEVTTMPTSQRTMAWLLILIWMIPGLAFAQRRARLVGKVVDPEGKPIQGVAVTVTSPQIPKLQGSRDNRQEGHLHVDFREIDVTYHYRFDKAGYQSLEVKQEWHLEGTQRFEWKMSPGGPSAARRRRPRPPLRSRRSSPSTPASSPSRPRTTQLPRRSSRRPCSTTPSCSGPGRR